MRRNKRSTDRFLKQSYKIIGLIFLLCACFSAAGVLLSWQLRNYDEIFRNNVITIYSVFVSGFIALFGVVLSILSSKAMDMDKMKYSHKPEFYIPCRYDLAKAINFRLISDGLSKITIPNKRIFLQNTDKTGFTIEEVKVFGENDNILIKDSLNQFIDKGLLFFLSFYCEEEIKKISIKTKSIDGYNYLFEICLDNKTVKEIEICL